MNSHTNKSQDELLLSFSDLKLICQKGKYKIFFGIIVGALLASLYTLSKPVEYHVEATFKERGKSQSGLSKSLGDFFFGGPSDSDSEAVSLMKSRKLMEDLIKKLHLQAVLVNEGQKPSSHLLRTMMDNLKVEYAYFNKKQSPVLPDSSSFIEVQEITFPHEVAVTLRLLFKSEEEFTVSENHTAKGSGILNQPFAIDNYQFTLVKKAEKPLKGQTFTLVLLPLASAAEGLSKQFNIQLDRMDKGLLRLFYKHRDRHLAASHLNELMDLYQNHLQSEHQRIANIQLGYLEKRQNKMGEELQELMASHAQMLASDVTSTGFANTAKAMDFYASNQAAYKQKLMQIALEIQRLEKAQEEELLYKRFISKEDSQINLISSEILDLKQQADALDLALRYGSPIDPKEMEEVLVAQLTQLEEIKASKVDAELILASLDRNNLKMPSVKLADNSKFMIKTWYEKLAKYISNPEEFANCKACFNAYLNNLVHLFDVHQKSIEERLAHQQAPQDELQGINLSIARDLYLAYSKEINDIQAKIIQDQFILKQIDEPQFELSSLSTVLNDPVSNEMISKSINLILAMRDKNNRSEKEVERLKSEISIQKGFLATHLDQTIQLLYLHMKHLKGKVQKTQSALLTLIEEQISILQKQMSEYVADRLASLRLEESLIKNSMEEMSQEMAHFPEKWVNEQLINQRMDLNQRMMEELIKLVESKNINSNLELIQSAPIDIAIAPIHPKPSKLMIFALLGAAVGAFFSVGWVLIASIVKGIQATTENLRFAGQHVSGYLTRTFADNSLDPILDSDLNTLRRLSSFLNESREDSNLGCSLLLIKGNGIDYSSHLARLLAKKGQKVILLPLSFDAQKDGKKDSSGLLQYLEGQTGEIQINHEKEYDYITPGGVSRFSNELIGSQKFQDLLQNLTNQYDWVIGVTHCSPNSAEAESITKYFQYVAVNVTGESLDQLKPYIYYPDSFDNNSKKITFVLNG